MISAEEVISLLNLKPLPGEGGYYSETYRSSEVIPQLCLPARYKSDKAYSTCIYYLLTPDTCSMLHRLPTDEIYHFYLGSPVTMLQLRPDGTTKVIMLGNDIKAGQEIQVVVPGGTWQGSFLKDGGGFSLMGTTMAPGFDPSDFEPASRDVLLRQYPNQSELIIRLTSYD